MSRQPDPLRGLRVPELVELVERLQRLAGIQAPTMARLAADVRHRRLARAERAATELLDAHRGGALEDGTPHRRCALCGLLEEQVAVAVDLSMRASAALREATRAEEQALGLVTFEPPETLD